MIRSIPTIASLAALRVAYAVLDAGARAANTLALLRDARRVERAARAAECEAARYERFAQAPGLPCPRCELSRAEARMAYAARDEVVRNTSDLRETLAEAIAQRDKARENLQRWKDDFDVEDAIEKYLPVDVICDDEGDTVIPSAAIEAAGAAIQQLRDEVAQAHIDAAQNLSAAQAVIADLRRELEQARAAVAQNISEIAADEIARLRRNLERGEEIASARVLIEDRVGYSGTSLLNTVQNAEQGLATILQAPDGECVREAAARVVRERDEATKNLAAAREVIADLKAAITDMRAARDQALAKLATSEHVQGMQNALNEEVLRSAIYRGIATNASNTGIPVNCSHSDLATDIIAAIKGVSHG